MVRSREIPSLFSDISSPSKTVRFSQADFLFSLGIAMRGQITINTITASDFSKASHKPNKKRPSAGQLSVEPSSEQYY